MKLLCHLSVVTMLPLAMAPSWAAPRMEARPDPRNFANGRLIPDEDYCDQPRMVLTREGTWVCILTTSAAQEGAAGQHVVAASSSDQGRTWSSLVDNESARDTHKSSYAIALITPADRIYAF